jgi:hypothetical protein
MATKVSLTCERCGKPVEAEFRYCPWCGRAFQQASAAPSAPSPSRAPDAVLVQFAPTDHPSAVPLRAAARKRPGFREAGVGGVTVYQAPFGGHELVELAELGALVERVPRKQVFLAGTEVPWTQVFGFLPCYLQRQMNENPESHCSGEESRGTFNLWGCVRADLPFSVEGQWCRWGSFDRGTTLFRFDVGRLREELERRTAEVRFCPALAPGLARSVLEVFPEAIDPHHDKDWTFVQARPGEPGMSVVVRTGFSGKERITVLGVGPRGRGAARDILAKVRRKYPSVPA